MEPPQPHHQNQMANPPGAKEETSGEYQLFSDKLRSIPVVEFNRYLLRVPEEQIDILRRARRILKRRQHAQTYLESQVEGLLEELYRVLEEKDTYKLRGEYYMKLRGVNVQSKRENVRRGCATTSKEDLQLQIICHSDSAL